ncbi:MAG: PQQ-binding-like beta-propeller repeat protein [Pirellulales bacterium]|nr:PQQ-binding-like beta-propeller repeat protein [Pirellulales bacterium]
MLRWSIGPNNPAVAAACLLALVIGPTARASEEWPQFRGPGGQGHAEAHDLPVHWTDNENVTWKTLLVSLGWSSPVISGDQIWLSASAEQGHLLEAICIARSSGKILRRVELFRPAELPPINAKNSYASPTPVLADDRLYVHFGTLGTACVDTTTGNVLWRNEELKLDHKEGPGSSPIVWHDLLIIPCDGIDVQFIVALDKHTGRIAWKLDRPGPFDENPDLRKAYCTPLIIESAGRTQLLTPGADHLLSLDPATGKILWQVGYKGFSNVPRPLYGLDLVFFCTGYMKPELWAVRPDGAGDVTETHVAWKTTRQVPANPSPVLVGERIYMVSDQGVATCLDARSGTEVWKHRLGGNFSASPVYADGKLFFCSEEGETHVLAPGDRFELLGKNQLQGKLLASPAIVGREIYLRTDQRLYRIEAANKPAAVSAAE